MADYYNTTRGPLSVTLNDGSSMAVSPKGWVFVAPGNENSASITKLVQKGYLVRAPVDRTPVAAEVAPAPAPVSEPAKKDEEAVPAPPPSAPTSSMKEEIHRKKR